MNELTSLKKAYQEEPNLAMRIAHGQAYAEALEKAEPSGAEPMPGLVGVQELKAAARKAFEITSGLHATGLPWSEVGVEDRKALHTAYRQLKAAVADLSNFIGV